MKSYKIVIYIFSILIALAVISVFFPKNGVTFGNKTLRFPSIVSMTEHYKADIAIDSSMTHVVVETTVGSDSLAHYRKMLATDKIHLYFPNNDFTFFDKFFEAAEHAAKLNTTVRILHYGDSQIEMDRITNNLRDNLHKLFGGYGPGLLPYQQTIYSLSVSQSSTGNPDKYAAYGNFSRAKDDVYGPLVKFFRVSGNTSFRAVVEDNKNNEYKDRIFSTVTLIYKADNNFNVTVKANGKTYEQTVPGSSKDLVRTMVWKLDTTANQVILSIKGSADIYGVALDGNYGVNIDNIPIRGSAGTFFSSLEPKSLTAAYDLLNVKMIILQFGGNSVPGIGGKSSIQKYASQIAQQIKFFQKVAPEATLLFIGPSDMSTKWGGELRTYTHLPQLIATLKDTVLAYGVAYWDIYEIMGGNSSMISWVKQGLACGDYIHFTLKGASVIGNKLSDVVSLLYNYYTLRDPKPILSHDALKVDTSKQTVVSKPSEVKTTKKAKPKVKAKSKAKAKTKAKPVHQDAE
ncbi:MAG: hypothetical protein LBU51_02870 [Bacteroidales bacterium]|jgi:lysophospholipase L1-like esterase|nr:hypothetical protein [Bacteroidales bacterium]